MASDDEKRKSLDDKLKLEAELMKPKVLSEQHKRLCEFIEEHKNDCDLYDFRCERYGDFLAVFIKRGEGQKRNFWYYRPSKTVSAISLMNNKTIQLKEGKSADTSASATFLRDSKYNDEKKCHDYSVKYEFSPSLNYRPMIIVDAVALQGSGTYYDRGLLGVNLDGCAAPAEDDSIRFEGSGVTLYTPFGKGKTVYDKILKAIKSGDR